MAGLQHKAALVTGGSRGIGRAIAERLAADGAAVVFSYRSNADAAADVVAGIKAAGGTAHAVQADLAGPGAARRLFDQAENHLTALGRIGQPGDVADVVAFLVSDDARWLTGQCIRAAGGLLA